MTNTLKQRATRSGSWVIFGHLTSQVLRLGSNLILTRLLVPELFGVIAIVTVIMAGLSMFSDVGLLQNIVQSKRGEEPDYLNTAWTIQIIRGFFIFFMALLSAVGLYYAGKFGYLSEETVYGNTQLPFILAVVSISTVISAFNSIHILLLSRKLMLGKSVAIELMSQVAGLILMLTWAWYQPDIWALVFGGTAAALTKMLLSHSLRLGEHCRFCWDKRAVHEIFHFGKWIFLTSIFGFLLNQGDKLLLGALISSKVLGVYIIAFFLANAAKDIIMKMSSSVFFPVFSEIIRDNPEKIEKTYYSIKGKIDVIVVFIAGVLFYSGHHVVIFLYDDRYVEAGWMLEVLSLSLCSIGFMLAGQMFIAYGKSKLTSIMAISQVLGLYVFVPSLYLIYGIHGAVWAIALNPMIRVLVSIILMKKYYFLKIYRELLIIPIFVTGLLVGNFLNKILD